MLTALFVVQTAKVDAATGTSLAIALGVPLAMMANATVYIAMMSRIQKLSPLYLVVVTRSAPFFYFVSTEMLGNVNNLRRPRAKKNRWTCRGLYRLDGRTADRKDERPTIAALCRAAAGSIVAYSPSNPPVLYVAEHIELSEEKTRVEGDATAASRQCSPSTHASLQCLWIHR